MTTGLLWLQAFYDYSSMTTGLYISSFSFVHGKSKFVFIVVDFTFRCGMFMGRLIPDEKLLANLLLVSIYTNWKLTVTLRRRKLESKHLGPYLGNNDNNNNNNGHFLLYISSYEFTFRVTSSLSAQMPQRGRFTQSGDQALSELVTGKVN